MGFQVTVVENCRNGFLERRDLFMRKVFPQIVNVRTLDQVVEALGR